ncbi:MAG TPA: glycosyltransferase family 1 protein [Ferruginibacter sp.]|nr:glycosyltransferase family 1 protein [Ferruginibacter sp.]
MTIAVDTRSLGAGRNEAGRSFERSYLLSFAQDLPQHHFLFIADKLFAPGISFPKNVTPLTVGPEIKNSLLMQYWFNYKLPGLLRKHKADVFVATEGICSLRTKTPQCLLIPDTSFLQSPLHFIKPNTRYYKKNTKAFLAKARSVAVSSEFSRSLLIDQYKEEAAKAEVITSYTDEMFTPIDPDEKENIKKIYAGGREYFLSPAINNPRSNLLNLLKAFSFFKKRQKSNMLLLITGDPGEAFMNELRTFRFRNEVKLIQNPCREEIAKITAAAYVLVYPVLYTDDAEVPLQAMQCRVPVITSNSGALPETCGDAALYVDPANFEDIAQKMMLVFKDEDQAKEMVRAGVERAGHFKKANSYEQLWSLIKKAANG